MATTRTKNKIVAKNLGGFIELQLATVQKMRDQKNLDQETKFQEMVLAGNLSLEDQIKYREQQYADALGDKAQRRKMRDSISTLKDLVEQRDYTNAYLDQVTKINSGIESYELGIKNLNEILSKTTDTSIQQDLKTKIASLESQAYAQKLSALNSSSTYAANSKTVSIIDEQIKKVNDQKNKELLAGNDDNVANLDLQLQNLNKVKTETKINNDSLSLALSTAVGNSALKTLDTLSKYIQDADSSSPITIGGVTYDNEQQFWTGKRTDFLTDRSSNGFFGRYKTEMSDQIEYKASKGILNNDSMADVNASYAVLKNRPELADFTTQIDQDKQAGLQKTADLRSESILNEYSVKDDAKKAINDLAYIQDTYGVDQTKNYQKVVLNAAQEKQQQVQGILSEMKRIIDEKQGISAQSAMQQAISSGAGATYSAEQFATKKPTDIINDMSNTAKNENFTENNPGTINPAAEAKTFTSPNEPSAQPKYVEGGLYKDPNSSSVMKFEGGKLRTFVGNWNEDQFKQATGKTFADVETVKNLTGVPQGEAITSPTPVPVTPAEQNPKSNVPAAPITPAPNLTPNLGTKISDPSLLKLYKADQIIKNGTDIYLKPEVKPIATKKLGSTEFATMQKQYDQKTLESKIVRNGVDIYLK